MNEEITRELLLNITPLKFLLNFGVGAIAVIFRFGRDLDHGVRKDPGTPFKFSFIYLIKGLFRLLGSLFILALAIARFPEFAPLLVNVAIPEGIDASVGVTIGTSALLGFNIDLIWKKLVGEAHKRGGKVIQKIKNGY